MDDVLATYKQLEHTLRYLAVVAEQADEGIAVFDPAGVVLFVNPAWAGMHGYRTTNELVGRPMSMFHTEGQMQARPIRNAHGCQSAQADVTAFIEEAKRTGQGVGLIEHVKSDRTPFLTQTKVIVVQDEAGRATGLVAFVRDITQRQQVEQMLRENARRAAQLREQTAQLQELLAQCREVEESLAKQAAELEADARELGQRIAAWAQSQQMPRQSADPPPGRPGPLSQREPESVAPLAPPGREKADHKRAADMVGTGSERTPRSPAPASGGASRGGGQPRRYPLDTEELRKVAELGRRLAGLS